MTPRQEPERRQLTGSNLLSERVASSTGYFPVGGVNTRARLARTEWLYCII
jgi:hypothetical protein